MHTPIAIAIFILVFIGVIWFLYRSTQRQIKKVLSGERSLDDKDIWLRHTEPLTARVLSKLETIKPEAAGIAKVDLELEVLPLKGPPFRTKTCWLVEHPNLPELEPGRSVEVKVDPMRPERVFPAVPWARAWLFGDKDRNHKGGKHPKIS
jgi:hypothetical protein